MKEGDLSSELFNLDFKVPFYSPEQYKSGLFYSARQQRRERKNASASEMLDGNGTGSHKLYTFVAQKGNFLVPQRQHHVAESLV